jgi:arsenate reductase
VSLRVYSYQGCSTCRSALKFLAERKIAHEVVPIREQPPTVPELRRMLCHIGGEVRRLFNSSGLEYQAMNLKERLPKLSEDEALALLAANGKLVKRPFALGAEIGLVGFKPAEWERLSSRAQP